jgi:hypothetical protein
MGGTVDMDAISKAVAGEFSQLFEASPATAAATKSVLNY